ncbi:MAG TPA: hypothetical protein VG496_12250, partial [Myxococcales bacterium]|nr:hypothetical protein [Myxococcales bacterium]
PWLALAVAAGAAALVRTLAALRRPWPAILAPIVAAGGVWILSLGFSNLRYELFRARVAQPVTARFEPVFARLRTERALVFLHYPPQWPANIDLGYNEPDLSRADLVRALDLGERNAELLAAFPARPAYRLDLGTLQLTQLR